MLNAEQSCAVQQTSHTLIVAIPGSGKTHLSIEYAKRIVTESLYDAVCMITFTDAAAQNMLKRVKKKLNIPEQKRVVTCTFHSAAWRIWRHMNPHRRLIMDNDRRVYVERAMRSVGWVDLEEAEEALEQLGCSSVHRRFDEHTIALYEKYRQYLEQDKVIELSVVMRDVVEGMQQGHYPSLKALYGTSHLVIDEFQDTDTLQYEFVMTHFLQGCTIFAIGDDDQSVYRFRNANGIMNLENFVKDIDGKVLPLITCYRCPQEILDAANCVINHCFKRYDKQLISALDRKGEVTLVEYQNASLDKLITQVAKNTSENHKPEGQAILARTNRTLTEFEMTLQEYGVTNYVKLGGKRFLDLFYIRFYLRMLYTFSQKSYSHLIESLAYFEVSESALDEVRKDMREHDFTEVIGQFVIRCHEPQYKRTHGISDELIDFLHTVTIDGFPEFENASDIAYFQRGIVEMLSIKNAGDLESLLRFTDMLTRMASKNLSLQPIIHHFYSQLQKKKRSADTDFKGKLVLSTLHGSKGLEFQHVSILHCVEGHIPFLESHDTPLLDDEHDEEARLFYVGMTRAEQSLTLYTMANKASRYIVDLYQHVNCSFIDLKEMELEKQT
ncbi:UvrD-helicase domain-containing protein [Vibrio maritimus]|uniref:UvrD-helicase domain-containing protein n=1 Tax=Vibrio maritimus TaxID=990268 RepID=UPI00406861AF